MRINTNVSALRASNYLNKSNENLTKSLERLSSGYRINRAADDAAGLAISQKMRTQIAGLDQANRNAADGISLIQTAEGALSEVTSMLQRMRELSVQAANATNTDEDRESIQAEIDQLNEEIQRISDTTEFNTIKLLDGSANRKSFSNVPSVSLISASDTVAVGSYTVNVTEDARQAVVAGATIGKVLNNADSRITEEQAGKININGIDITISKGDTVDQVYENIRNGCEKANVTVFAVADLTNTNLASPETAGYTAINSNEITASSKLVFVSQGYGSSESIEINCDNTELCGLLGLSESTITAKGSDVSATKGAGFASTATISTSGNTIKVTDANGFEMELEAEALGTVYIDTTADGTTSSSIATGLTDKSVTVTVLSAGSLKLQIGANEGQLVEVTIPEVTPKTLGIDSCNLLTTEGAQAAISAYDNAITEVSAIRAKLGAYQNRLDYATSNLSVASENMTEALSRIADTDMASEMAQYTQQNVLVQAGTSMLAQANQRPQQILSLLNA